MSTIRKGVRTARKQRYCANGHVILPGDLVRYWVGTSDAAPGTGFCSYEQCEVCITQDGGDHSTLSDLPRPERRAPRKPFWDALADIDCELARLHADMDAAGIPR